MRHKNINLQNKRKLAFKLSFLLRDPFYTTYNKIQKNCKILATNMHKWKIECIHLCFFPNPYRTAPIVQMIPPKTNNTNPVVPSNSGRTFTLKTIHHPITK